MADDQRFEALRTLGRRYELGEITDAEFKQLKREILHGATTDAALLSPQIELVLATDTRLAVIDADLDRLHARWNAALRGLIDAVLITRSVTGAVRVRFDLELSRPIIPGEISIGCAVCGLLLPLGLLLPGHLGTPIAASFNALVAVGQEQALLLELGRSIDAATTSILVVCVSQAAGEIADALSDAEHTARHLFGDDIAHAISDIL